MVVKVFCAEISSNIRVKTRQDHVKRILEIRGIPFEAIDITSEDNGNEKEFMASNATKRRGSSANVALAPQIFNDDVYCGDYEDFDEANENGTLLEFLRIKTDEGAEDDSQKTPTQEGKNDTDSTEAVSAEGN